MTPADFVDLIQRFIAVEAVPANALRNQGVGVPQRIQAALADIDLRTVPVPGRSDYERWLDEKTDAILVRLCDRPGPWGTVRKALNLFMRACICNHYLRQEYKLDRIEEHAELPLDSLVATALKRDAGRGRLPRWPGLKNLRAEDHRVFQNAASALAARHGIHPKVYLDNHLWLQNR